MFPPAVDLTVYCRLAYLEPPVERNTGFSPHLVSIRHAPRSLGEMTYTVVLIPFFHTEEPPPSLLYHRVPIYFQEHHLEMGVPQACSATGRIARLSGMSTLSHCSPLHSVCSAR